MLDYQRLLQQQGRHPPEVSEASPGNGETVAQPQERVRGSYLRSTAGGMYTVTVRLPADRTPATHRAAQDVQNLTYRRARELHGTEVTYETFGALQDFEDRYEDLPEAYRYIIGNGDLASNNIPIYCFTSEARLDGFHEDQFGHGNVWSFAYMHWATSIVIPVGFVTNNKT